MTMVAMVLVSEVEAVALTERVAVVGVMEVREGEAVATAMQEGVSVELQVVVDVQRGTQQAQQPLGMSRLAALM